MISPGGLLSVVGKCEEVHNPLMDWLGKLQQWMNPIQASGTIWRSVRIDEFREVYSSWEGGY
jgi:hypothetical protein